MNFNNASDPVPEANDYQMNLPSRTSYKDMNADTSFLSFTLPDLNNYLAQFGKELARDTKDLYQERYLHFVCLCDKEDLLYIKSECRAQMKKAVTYTIDIIFSKDGNISEAQCECAAGMGPEAHCKHVLLTWCCEVKLGQNSLYFVLFALFEVTST